MSVNILSKENISWATGISVVSEDEGSYRQRVAETRRYYETSHEIATQATAEWVNKGAEGHATNSVRAFSIQTRWQLAYFKPSSRKRWLEISGLRIPLPPQRSR